MNAIIDPRVSTTVDLMTAIANGPMADTLTYATERMAVLTLDTENLRGNEYMTMGELARRIGLSRAAMTSLTDRLVKRGIVVRTIDRSDRRCTRLTLTTRGRRLVAAAIAAAAEDLAS